MFPVDESPRVSEGFSGVKCSLYLWKRHFSPEIGVPPMFTTEESGTPSAPPRHPRFRRTTLFDRGAGGGVLVRHREPFPRPEPETRRVFPCLSRPWGVGVYSLFVCPVGLLCDGGGGETRSEPRTTRNMACRQPSFYHELQFCNLDSRSDKGLVVV